MVLTFLVMCVSLLTGGYALLFVLDDFCTQLMKRWISSTPFRWLSVVLDGMYQRYTYARLNHTIKIVLASKKELTRAHIDPISSRNWKEVLAWITFNPEELLLVDKRKLTILHHACLVRAPAVVIEMILFHAPELSGKKNLNGEIPLHWAVRLSSPIEVLQLLLSVDPGLGCTSKDKEGNTALSLIWERHCETLLNIWWQEGRDKLIESHWWKRILFLLESYHCSFSYPAPFPKQELNNRVMNHSHRFLALHTATRSSSAPLSLYPLLLKVYNHQIRERDAAGRLPLAVACLDALSNRSTGASTKIQLLLQEDPSAADVTDYYMRFPLFYALESGIAIDEGIWDLLKASPKTFQLTDPVTRLPPFLLAAVGAIKRQQLHEENCLSSQSHRIERHLDDLRSLNTIFTVLRANPSQLSQIRSVDFSRTNASE